MTCSSSRYCHNLNKKRHPCIPYYHHDGTFHFHVVQPSQRSPLLATPKINEKMKDRDDDRQTDSGLVPHIQNKEQSDIFIDSSR